MRLNFDFQSALSVWSHFEKVIWTCLDELVSFLLLQHTPKIVILLAENVYFSSQFGNFSPWLVDTIVVGPVEGVLYVYWQQMMEKAHTPHDRYEEEGKTTYQEHAQMV